MRPPRKTLACAVSPLSRRARRRADRPTAARPSRSTERSSNALASYRDAMLTSTSRRPKSRTVSSTTREQASASARSPAARAHADPRRAPHRRPRLPRGESDDTRAQRPRPIGPAPVATTIPIRLPPVTSATRSVRSIWLPTVYPGALRFSTGGARDLRIVACRLSSRQRSSRTNAAPTCAPSTKRSLSASHATRPCAAGFTSPIGIQHRPAAARLHRPGDALSSSGACRRGTGAAR